MRHISILGAGRVGSTLGTALAAAGHMVNFGVRDPEASRAKWTGPATNFKPLAEAARNAEIIINATPGETSVETLTALEPELTGKILIDIGNATARDAEGIPCGLLYSDGSLAEAIQAALPQTAVVKTLNTVLFPVMANPALLSTAASIFLSGNDKDAKAVTRELLHDLGWSDASIEDLGGIDSARGTEALLLIVPYLIRSRGLTPFALTVAR